MMSPLHKEEYGKSTKVKIRDRDQMLDFMATWKYHDKLQTEQLEFAGVVATVKSVGYYHGGDVLYWLEGVPGAWHEVCLSAA
jgi:hypothetical protein